MFTLYYKEGNNCEELDLMSELLHWQQLPSEVWPGDAECMKRSKGTERPVAVRDGETVAVGFFQLVDYLKRKGLVRCQ
jgi:hypothetical protein